jgi:hypothetical protein
LNIELVPQDSFLYLWDLIIILSQQAVVITSVWGGETACLQFPIKVLLYIQEPSLTIGLFIVSQQDFSLNSDFL